MIHDKRKVKYMKSLFIAEKPSVAQQFADVLGGVGCPSPGTIVLSSYIHGIGSAENGLHATIHVACRSKEFDGMHHLISLMSYGVVW